jgi:hypothetical protein
MRNKIINRVLLLFFNMTLWCACDLYSQQPPDAAIPRIIFGTVAADKGTVASLPVYINGGMTGLRRLAVSLDFISNSVRFEKVDSSASSSDATAKIVVQPRDLPPDAKGLPRTRLYLVAESPNGLMDGLLTFLNFKLAADAKPFAVTLQPAEIQAEDSGGKPVKPIAEAGKVIVSAEDETSIGCFFFTH